MLLNYTATSYINLTSGRQTLYEGFAGLHHASEHYELVGLCYVHDFMDGQAMASLRVALENDGVEARGGLSVALERIHAELKSFILV
jgi:hypothetical protein